jgi:hypothetical protein
MERRQSPESGPIRGDATLKLPMSLSVLKGFSGFYY